MQTIHWNMAIFIFWRLHPFCSVTYDINISSVIAAEHKSLGNKGVSSLNVASSSSLATSSKLWGSNVTPSMTGELVMRLNNSWALTPSLIWSTFWQSDTSGELQMPFCRQVLLADPIVGVYTINLLHYLCMCFLLNFLFLKRHTLYFLVAKVLHSVLKYIDRQYNVIEKWKEVIISGIIQYSCTLHWFFVSLNN